MTRRTRLAVELVVAATVVATIVTVAPKLNQVSAGDMTWISPTDGATLHGTTSLRVNAPRNTAKVGFFVDNEWVANDTNGSPWEGEFDTTAFADGEHRIKAAARDRNGTVLGRIEISVIISQAAGSTQPDASPKPDEQDPASEPDYAGLPGATPVPEQPEHEDHEAPTGARGSCGESMRHWHPPVVDGCATGHEHGDDPDPYGYFAARGVPDLDFDAMKELMQDHDGHAEAHAGYKIIYHDGGTPKNPSDDWRTAYHQISTSRNTARFYEKDVSERDPRFEDFRVHSVMAQALGPNNTYTSVTFLDFVADMHPLTDPKRMRSLQEIKNLWSLYARDPRAAICRLKAEDPGWDCGEHTGSWPKESWYWVEWTGGNKEGVKGSVLNYSLTDRILNPPSYIIVSRDGDDRLEPLWTCDANGIAHTRVDCPADGTLRYVDQAQIKIVTSKRGTVWTDVYALKIYGTGKTAPKDCDGPCVKQHIGTDFGPGFQDRLMWYDVNGSSRVIAPN